MKDCKFCHRCKLNKNKSNFVGKYPVCWDCRRSKKYKYGDDENGNVDNI